jgi:hypothetical protein
MMVCHLHQKWKNSTVCNKNNSMNQNITVPILSGTWKCCWFIFLSFIWWWHTYWFDGVVHFRVVWMNQIKLYEWKSQQYELWCLTSCNPSSYSMNRNGVWKSFHQYRMNEKIVQTEWNLQQYDFGSVGTKKKGTAYGVDVMSCICYMGIIKIKKGKRGTRKW